MLEQTHIDAVGAPFWELVEAACKKGLSCLPDLRAVNCFNRIFSDADIIATCFRLFENDLNVSKTAKSLYMHRNTLIYRLGKIKKITGLEITRFSDAATFVIMYGRYCEGRFGRK